MYTHYTRVLSRHSDRDVLKATLKSKGSHHLWDELEAYTVIKLKILLLQEKYSILSKPIKQAGS